MVEDRGGISEMELLIQAWLVASSSAKARAVAVSRSMDREASEEAREDDGAARECAGPQAL